MLDCYWRDGITGLVCVKKRSKRQRSPPTLWHLASAKASPVSWERQESILKMTPNPQHCYQLQKCTPWIVTSPRLGDSVSGEGFFPCWTWTPGTQGLLLPCYLPVRTVPGDGRSQDPGSWQHSPCFLPPAAFLRCPGTSRTDEPLVS